MLKTLAAKILGIRVLDSGNGEVCVKVRNAHGAWEWLVPESRLLQRVEAAYHRGVRDGERSARDSSTALKPHLRVSTMEKCGVSVPVAETPSPTRREFDPPRPTSVSIPTPESPLPATRTAPAFDPDTWPTHGGRFLCAPSQPMPTPMPSNTRWAHTSAKLTHAGEYRDWYRCDDCGHEYSTELAE